MLLSQLYVRLEKLCTEYHRIGDIAALDVRLVLLLCTPCQHVPVCLFEREALTPRGPLRSRQAGKKPALYREFHLVHPPKNSDLFFRISEAHLKRIIPHPFDFVKSYVRKIQLLFNLFEFLAEIL